METAQQEPSGPFKRLNAQDFAQSTTDETAEQRYWQRFKNVRNRDAISFGSAVTSVAVGPSAGARAGAGNFDFAVSSGPRVCVYDGRTGALRKSLNRFKDVAFGASFRHDGKLLAAGCQNSQVYIFEMSKGALLRMFKGHTGPVRATGWSKVGSHVLTCSDDKTVRFWDVSTEEELGVWRGHTDQVRCCSAVEGSSLGAEIWATGSYDHSVRLWDVRAPASNGAVGVLAQGGPVEAVLALAGDRLAAAVGNKVRVWDLKTKALLRDVCDHQRTVTALFLDGLRLRVVSGSLDGLLKVFDAATLESQASVVIGSGQGILGAAMSADNSTLIVGCVSGQCVVKKRSTAAGDALDRILDDKTGKGGKRGKEAAAAGPARGGTRRYFMRGGNVGPSPGDFKVAHRRGPRLAKYDRHLKQFNYKQALDEVLASMQPVLVAGLLEELEYRDGLEAALSGRNDAQLEPVLSFLAKYLTHPRFALVLVDVADVVIRLYSSQLGQSIMVDELFVKLQKQLKSELRLQKDLIKMSGTMDLILSAAPVPVLAAASETDAN